MQRSNLRSAALFCLVFCLAVTAPVVSAQNTPGFTPEWVQRSNEIAYRPLALRDSFRTLR
jgi:acetyl-CoA carboxylase carboxyltransferase component